MNNELKPCPFCGKIPEIIVCDDEGNIRTKDYEEDPWSGLSFALMHNMNDNNECIIATYRDELLGIHLFDSREEAIEMWNKGALHTCTIEIDEEGIENLYLTPEDTWAYKCSSCEGEFRYDRSQSPNYCPKCGAKSVKP